MWPCPLNSGWYRHPFMDNGWISVGLLIPIVNVKETARMFAACRPLSYWLSDILHFSFGIFRQSSSATSDSFMSTTSSLALVFFIRDSHIMRVLVDLVQISRNLVLISPHSNLRNYALWLYASSFWDSAFGVSIALVNASVCISRSSIFAIWPEF